MQFESYIVVHYGIVAVSEGDGDGDGVGDNGGVLTLCCSEGVNSLFGKCEPIQYQDRSLSQ